MQKRKHIYTEPEMEILIFQVSDIITTSGGNDYPDSEDTDWGGGQPLQW